MLSRTSSKTEAVPPQVVDDVEAMIDGLDYEFTYDFFQEESRVASKFCQWVCGVLSEARCRFIIDNIDAQINQYEAVLSVYKDRHGALMEATCGLDHPT